ncbi:60S ribosomal protein L24/L30, putative [Theileria annulata]|uniref:60S ribosomal protein L24/L30, putative n=1 Tax=Theileria annulata TaxID=5874 RepID=Q4UCL2_THEAN|nr:60S ribosomal protein L24/L30, putative [Theileria annulata]CAI75439.1 60S ribosomal protein L24/L30, putative [Theileria annulata]|eukprot:XP_954915.1 60S ribosomal protein L24/L30, putative [Theileria annulata]
MNINKCWLCSSNIYPGHGIVFVRNDSKIFRFCRSKCHRHFKAKHNPRKIKWTKAYRRLQGKELRNDENLEMELRKNRPVRYDRDLYIKAIKAIKQTERVEYLRKMLLHKERRRNLVSKKLSLAQKELEKHKDILPIPLDQLDIQQLKLLNAKPKSTANIKAMEQTKFNTRSNTKVNVKEDENKMDLD